MRDGIMPEMFVVVCFWPDGDVVYRVRDGSGTREPTKASLFSREEAEIVADRLRGGMPEFVGELVDVISAPV